jgi:DeoR/GlpR family transcriptional regulator of sugar metabolism
MPAQAVKLLAGERRREIARIAAKEGRLSVEDLVRRFRVSAVTLRADLGVLAQEGVIIRSYGGAILPNERGEEFPLKIKEAIHHAEKVRIGRAAAHIVGSNQRVILDSGTTSAEVARAINRSNLEALTVITHALNIAQEFQDNPKICVIMIGGIMRHVSGSFVGPQAERLIQELHADHCFLGVDGIDAELNLSTPDLLEAQLNRSMMQVSHEVTVIADASKFGRRSLSLIGHIKSVRRVITDEAAPAETVRSIQAQGIEVVLA